MGCGAASIPGTSTSPDKVEPTASKGAVAENSDLDEKKYNEDIRLICDSPKAVEINLDALVTMSDREKAAAQCAKWIAGRLMSERARQIFGNLAPLDPKQKASTVRMYASQAGIAFCPITKIWDFTAAEVKPTASKGSVVENSDLGQMSKLGTQMARGSRAAVDQLEKRSEELYKNINYRTEKDRLISNLRLMEAAFAPVAEQAGRGSQAALETLKYANGKRTLRSFTSDAFGIAASMGNREALDILLKYKENGFLLSSTVGALQPAAEKNIPQAVDFLVGVIQDPNSRALWHMASQGLVGAAALGNEKAKKALRRYARDDKN